MLEAVCFVVISPFLDTFAEGGWNDTPEFRHAVEEDLRLSDIWMELLAGVRTLCRIAVRGGIYDIKRTVQAMSYTADDGLNLCCSGSVFCDDISN